MNPKVSIIIPIHNAGIYLYKCMDTLINQTLKDIEIICVLDCPTDGSEKIIQEYQQKDNRIKIIQNKENLYIGLSRNEGLKIATGEYIGFSDHDDWRELDMYEQLYNKAKQDNAEIVVSDFYEINIKKNIFEYISIDSDKVSENYQKKHYLELLGPTTFHFKKTNIIFLSANIWHRIYKKDFITNNEILFFDNRKTAYDDLIFNIQAHQVARQVSYIYQPYYYHLSHDNNSFSKYTYNQLSKTLSCYDTIYQIISTPEEETRINNRMFFYFFIQLKITIKNFKQKDLYLLITNKTFLEIFKNKHFPFTVKQTQWKYFFFILGFGAMKLLSLIYSYKLKK